MKTTSGHSRERELFGFFHLNSFPQLNPRLSILDHDGRPPMPVEAEIRKLLFSEKIAAQMLSISVRTLFALRTQGRIDHIKLTTGKKSRVLYPLAALEKFIASNVVTTARPTA
jgi:hypothetical protein